MALPIPKPENLPELVRRYAEGRTSLRKLARELGVDHKVLYRWLLAETGEAHAEVVTSCLVARIADADEDLEGATDKTDVAKRTAQARFARMDYERRRPNLYGVKQEVKHTSDPVLHIHTTALDGGGRVVEGTQVPSTLPAPADE